MRHLIAPLGSAFGWAVSNGAPSRKRWLLATLGCLVFSCMPQSQAVAPQVAPSATLSLGEIPEGTQPDFDLIHAAPEGNTTGDPTVHLIFSRPLHELGIDVPVPAHLELIPAVVGNWRWLGAYGVTFVPEAGRLPRSTAFQVRIDPQLSANDGTPLGQSRSFEFETPRPLVKRAHPDDRWFDYLTSQPIQIDFSQPVQLDTLRPYLDVAADSALSFKVEQGSTPSQVLIKPEGAWPLDSTISYRLRAGYRGKEGDLPAHQEFTGSFKTYGPLTARVICEEKPNGSCRPEGGLRLELSNPVPARKLARSIFARGAPLQIDQDWGADATTRHILLASNLPPRSQLTVSVGPIQDIYGQPLKWIKNRKLVVSDLRPQVQIGFSGEFIATDEKQLSILSTNASYHVTTAPLSEESLQSINNSQHEEDYKRLATLTGARTFKVPVGPLNQTSSHALDLNTITPRGPFVIGVTYQSEGDSYFSIKRGQRTDLGVTVKEGRKKSHVWVTDLQSGTPISNARVKVLGTSAVSKTNQSGLASLDPGQFVAHADKQREPQWLVVQTNDDKSFHNRDQTLGGWRIDAPTDYYGDPGDLASLFPERDLFRPGEQAWLKGYVRRPVSAGSQPLTNRDYTLELVSPDGEVVSSQKARTNRFGAISSRLTIPGSAALGYWNVRLKEGATHLASAHLQIAEFRAAEFEVKVHPQQTEALAGDTLSFQVDGTYLYGGSMNRSRVEYNLARRASSFKPAETGGYVTNDNDWQYHEEYRPFDPTLRRDVSKLDEHGSFSFEFAPELDHQVGPEMVELEATVFDLSGQTISSRRGVLVHPSAYYLGIRTPESYLIDSPGEVSPQIRAFSPRGKPVVGRNTTLTLYRLHWTHVRQRTGAHGSETVSKLIREVVSSCTLVTQSEDQSCPLPVRDTGHHVIRARSTDQAGRTVHASTSVFAVGEGRAAAFRDWDERGSVEVIADRASYSPGQRARLLIKSPFEKARAWVTVERDEVRQQFVVPVEGSTPTIELPTTDDMRPNVFVGVHLVEDRKSLGPKAHRISDSYRVGYATLAIDPEQRRLFVDVRANKEDYQPGDEVQLQVQVKDQAGRPGRAEIALYVVDEGVLSLSGYQLPDPLLSFTRPRPLRVETLEGRESIARLFGLGAHENENKGDPGGGGGDERSEMKTTAYFNPSVETDDQGRAEVRFTLPDNVGKFRIMALAVSDDDRYGKGRSDIRVNLPLMVRPALPRFLRAGDEVELSATISSFGAPSGTVSVRAETAGLELIGSKQQTVELPEQSSRLVSFRAKSPNVGQAQIRFSAQLDRLRDATGLEREVKSPALLETVALYGKTEDAQAFRLGDLKAAHADHGGLDVTLSSSALVGLKGGFEQLWDYPYLCSEQLSSRILPSVLLEELASLYSIAPPPNARAQTEQSVAQLLRRQHGNGGFGMWPESREVHPWVSAYALWVLHEAKQKGHVVGKRVFERGIRYLRDLSKKRQKDDLVLSSFSTFVLARLGHHDPATINALVELLPQMDVEAQLFLAWAAALDGTKAHQELLLKRVSSALTPRGNRVEVAAPHGDFRAETLGTPLRLHSLTLSALLALSPNHPLAAGLVRALLDARKGGQWGSTQESAFALLALDAYRRAQEQTEPDFLGLVFLKNKLLGQRRFVGRSSLTQEFSIAMKELVQGGNLVFQRQGQGTLFFEARLAYARKELPSSPLENGFLVKKELTQFAPAQDPDTRPPNADEGDSDRKVSQLNHGDLVLVELNVLVPARRRFVVVDDPLPAGLEAIDLSLTTAQGSLRKLLLPTAGYAQAWHRTEYRDDRVLFFVDDMPPGVYQYRYLARATTRGTFIVPPTMAKEMYQEEVYGRTGATRVSVK